MRFRTSRLRKRTLCKLCRTWQVLCDPSSPDSVDCMLSDQKGKTGDIWRGSMSDGDMIIGHNWCVCVCLRLRGRLADGLNVSQLGQLRARCWPSWFSQFLWQMESQVDNSKQTKRNTEWNIGKHLRKLWKKMNSLNSSGMSPISLAARLDVEKASRKWRMSLASDSGTIHLEQPSSVATWHHLALLHDCHVLNVLRLHCLWNKKADSLTESKCKDLIHRDVVFNILFHADSGWEFSLYLRRRTALCRQRTQAPETVSDWQSANECKCKWRLHIVIHIYPHSVQLSQKLSAKPVQHCSAQLLLGNHRSHQIIHCQDWTSNLQNDGSCYQGELQPPPWRDRFQALEIFGNDICQIFREDYKSSTACYAMIPMSWGLLNFWASNTFTEISASRFPFRKYSESPIPWQRARGCQGTFRLVKLWSHVEQKAWHSLTNDFDSRSL